MIARIGKYEIQSELGHGAFGRVFRAYDPQMRREVAIKVLIADNDPDLLARFRVEAGAAGNLNHKNIVTVYEYSEYEGKPYIVMEMLAGESLQQSIARGAQLSLLDKVRVVFQAAEGLACAHEHNVVHRDIKPANIMLLRNGDVKIMDFGIARVTGEAETRRTRQGDLIGTILYMSPERIHGTDADACSDVFSFGVVCYEFITGKHPFEGETYGAVIYKITSVEPLSLLHIVPECPEALDHVIQRAMAKDREVRYQKMEEILFDLRPALVELAQRQSAYLMEEAQELMASGEISEAQEKVRFVLEIDPSNQDARRVHESLLKDRRRRVVQARVERLVQDGQAQFEQRQFTQAIQLLESALRLDSSDAQAQSLLAQARAALEATRQASRLVSEARREMLAGNLAAANRNVIAALQADPQNRDALALSDKLRQQIEERDRHLRVESSLRRAKELLAQTDFAGARAVLTGIEHEVEADVLVDLRSRIDGDEAEYLRRVRETRVQDGLAIARQQIQANQLAEAAETLHLLLEEFPDSTAAGKLLATLQDHVEAQRRAEEVNKLTQEALGLIQEQRFLDACLLLGSGLQTYPNDFALHRLLDRAVDLQRTHARAKEIGRVLEEARELQGTGRQDDAISRVNDALREHGHDSALADLKRQLEFEREQQQYVVGVRDALTAGRGLLAQRRFNDAVAALELSAVAYPGQPDLASLLNSARQSKAEQEEQQFVDETCARLEELERGEKRQDALDHIGEALKRYPYNAKLLGLAASGREKWRQQQRREDIARRREVIDQAIEAGDWTRADMALRTARQDFPEEKAFDNLDERFRQGQLQAQLKSLGDQVQQSFTLDDLESASNQLSAARALSGQLLWQSLQQELGRRRAYRNSLQRARELEEGDEQAAEELLTHLVQENPPDAKAAELLRAICSKRSARERAEAIVQGIREIEANIRSQAFPEAMRAAERLAAAFPGDARIAQALSRVGAKQRRAERQQAYQQALDQAERLRVASQYEEAERLLGDVVGDALDSRAAGLLEKVVAEHGRVERQRRLEQGKSQIRALLDRGDVTAALAASGTLQRDFSDDPELAGLRAAAEQRQVVSQAFARIRDLEQRKQLDAALELAQQALQRAPQNLELANAAERLQELVRQAALDQLAETIHISLSNNELQRARGALEAARQQVGEEPLWQTLYLEVEQRLAFEAVLRDAEQCIQQRDYAQAEHLLRSAIEQRADPRAYSLLEAVSAQLERERKDQAIREGRRQVSALVLKGEMAEALAVVDRLSSEYPGDAGLVQDRQAILHRIELDFVNETLARLTGLQKQQQWDAALAEAETAAARYRGNSELQAALGRLRDVALQERRRTEISRLAQEIHRSIATRQWADAEGALQAARERFAGEKIFGRLTEGLQQARRQNDLEDLRSLVLRCFSEDNLDEASRQIARKEAEWHQEPVWQDLNSQLKLRQTYAEVLREAERLRRAQDYEHAEAMLRQAIAKGAPDTRAATLLQTIGTERLPQERDSAISWALREADRLVQSGKPADALGLLDRVCREYPDDAALEEKRRDLAARFEQQRLEAQRQDAERRQASERARRIASLRAPIDSAIAEEDLEAALDALDVAQRQFVEEQVFAELRAQVTQARRRNALAALETAVRHSFERGDLDEAARRLAAGQLDFSEEPLWLGLTDELARRQHYNQLLAEAEQLCIQGDTDAAKQKLTDAISIDPKDARAPALLKEVEAGKKIKIRRKRRWKPVTVLWLGVGVALVLALVILLSLPKRPEEEAPITLEAKPPTLHFIWDVDKPDPPSQMIDVNPANIRLQGSGTDDWLAVRGVGQSGRLEVSVKPKDLHIGVGSYGATVVVRAPGRKMTNDPLFISVRLEVRGVESPLIPLKLASNSLTFPSYTPNSAVPAPLEIRASEGDIGNVSVSSNWLQATNTRKSVRIAVLPRTLQPGEHDGYVSVTSADLRVDRPVQVSVHLTVLSPPKQVDTRSQEPRPTPIPTPTPTPPQPPPPACSDKPIVGSSEGSTTWRGTLLPGESVVLGYDSVQKGSIAPGSGPFPRQPLTILQQDPPPPDLVVVQLPSMNDCRPLELKNKGATTIRTFTVHWRVSR